MLRSMLTADYPCQLLYVSLCARHKQTHPETPISARSQVVIRKAFKTTEADVKKYPDREGFKQDTPSSGAPCPFTFDNDCIHDSFLKKNNTTLSASPHGLVIQEEKYSHLRLRIKATFHSGAFFKTLNYSFLEAGCDEAQALTGCFHVWQATSQPALPAKQSASPPSEAAAKYPDPPDPPKPA